MFTGLIEEVGTVKSLVTGTVNRLSIKCSKITNGISLGDSVAINGVCLTVIRIGSQEVDFDAVKETISRSTLGELKPNDKVNLEASLCAGKPIGGHFVLGHVDGVGEISSIKSEGESKVISFIAPDAVSRYLVEKGSIAIDGISLTIANCSKNIFSVAVIPHTLENTTLINKKPGNKVNLEADIIGKYVEKFTNTSKQSAVTQELLKNAGFM
jgi:riboflavin synthase